MDADLPGFNWFLVEVGGLAAAFAVQAVFLGLDLLKSEKKGAVSPIWWVAALVGAAGVMLYALLSWDALLIIGQAVLAGLIIFKKPAKKS